jgi:hypothetical protein
MSDVMTEEVAVENLQQKTVPTSTGMGNDLFLAQYQSLRSEILQRLGQRQELLTYTLPGAASFLSIGVQLGISAVTVLCYPALSFFLACAWGQHDNRIGQINLCLREIEDTHLVSIGPGWESYRRGLWTKSRKSLAALVTLPAQGLFIGSQLLALSIGVARFSADPQMMVLFILLVVIDVVAMLMTLFVLRRRRDQGVEKGVNA